MDKVPWQGGTWHVDLAFTTSRAVTVRPGEAAAGPASHPPAARDAPQPPRPGVAVTVVPVAGSAGAPGASPTVPATPTQGRRQLTSEAPVCHRNRAGSRAGESALAVGRRLSPRLPVPLSLSVQSFS
jgi:hypothetical protein